MKSSILISQKSFMAELFYMFFWERVCFTPLTNEVWFIIPRYSDGKFEISLHKFEEFGNLDAPSYSLEFWASREIELSSTLPHHYGKCFKRKMDELLKKSEADFKPSCPPYPPQVVGTN